LINYLFTEKNIWVLLIHHNFLIMYQNLPNVINLFLYKVKPLLRQGPKWLERLESGSSPTKDFFYFFFKFNFIFI